MRFTDRLSWQVTEDAPQHLALGLYVRAAAGLESFECWPPPASPEIRSHPAPPAAEQQWEAWFAGAIRDQPEGAGGRWWLQPPFGSLAGAPELRELTAAYFGDALRWSADRKQEHVNLVIHGRRGLGVTTLVAQMEKAMDAAASPFSLTVTVIPVAGPWSAQISPDHLVVSADVFSDPDECRRRLTPVIRALS